MQITTIETLYNALDTGIEKSGLIKKDLIEKVGLSSQGFYASWANKTFRTQTVLDLIRLMNGRLSLTWPGEHEYLSMVAEPAVPDNSLLNKYIDSLENRIKDKDRLIESLYKQIDSFK